MTAPTVSPGQSSVELISLAHSLQPLQDHFNTHRDRARVIVLVSPT